MYFCQHDFGNGFGYIYFVNKEEGKQANITVDMMKSRNIALMSPFAPNSLKPKLNIPGG